MTSSMTDIQALRPTVAHLVYARRPQRSLCLDLYLPSRRPAPVVVWLHGGGWHMGDKGNPYVKFLVHEGYAIVDVAYRLSGEAPAPANLHDVLAALRWIERRGPDYGLDTRRIALSGGSAGAHLAMLAAAAPDHPLWLDPQAHALPPPPPVRAICALAGPTDIACAREIQDHPNADDYQQVLCALLGGPYEEHLETARALSPIRWISDDLPPTLIIHGSDDQTVDVTQARRYVQAMRQAGATITYHEDPGGHHRSDTWDWPQVTTTIRAFFQRHLR